MCPFGTAPGTLNVTSQMTVLAEGKPIATITDTGFPVNIAGFGMCSSMANPQVAAATAAALGVLTPQPCAMVPAGTWMPAAAKVLAGNKPCFCNDAKLMCAYGGSISVCAPGQSKIIT